MNKINETKNIKLNNMICTKLETLIYGTKKSNTIGIIYISIVLMFFTLITILSDINNVILLLMFVLILFFSITRNSKRNSKNIKIFLKSIDKNLKQKIEKELENPLIYCNYHYALTENYIIKVDNPYIILEYKDIIMMYQKTHYNLGKYSTRGIDTYLVLITKENQKYEFLISTTILTLNYELKNISDVIKQKKTDVLEEKTKENIKLIKQKYNIDLK